MTQDQQPPKEEVTEFGSIDALATVVYNWHKNGVKLLKHMMEIPEGTEMTYADNGIGTTMTLEGNVLLAFKAGVAQALAELGTLPFYAELEDGTSTETNESTSNDPNA